VRISTLLARAESQALERADRIIGYGESEGCRQAQIAEHFGESLAEPCGTCDACTGERRAPAAAPDTLELPEDVAGTILRTVASLRWPLGHSGLSALLSGSVSAPPSARRSPSFGALAAARPGTVKRWLRRLVETGHLEVFESEDGFRLLRLGPAAGPPPRLTGAEPAAAENEPLFAQLREWRLARAREDGVPPFVVFSDRTLRAVAAAKPAQADELAIVHGIGPTKLERYGAEILAEIARFPG
jgi:ATP-dependent DNA helicase RecQ